MRKHISRALLALFALVCSANVAGATLSNYVFSIGYSEQYDMGKATTLWQGSTGNPVSGQVSNIKLPFTFVFDGTGYSDISVSSEGVLGLGSTDVTNSGSNDLAGQSVPVIAPYWDNIRLSGLQGGNCGTAVISYVTTGSSPNRVFVVEYHDFEAVQIFGSPNRNTMQVRLHEGSNKIEFWYGEMSACDNCYYNGQCNNTSASIGLATGSSNFISVTPDRSGGSASYDRVNNSVDLYNDQIEYNLTYTFLPCNVDIVGNQSEGGTGTMADGDQLFRGFQVQRGNSQPYFPFSLNNSTEGCSERTYTYTITGPAAAEYQISESGGTIGVGESSVPSITFTPSTIGVRNATLTVRDDNGFLRRYALMAEGTTRIEWIGNLAQGGTANLNSGDTLLRGMSVRRGQSQTYLPITIHNFNDNGEAPTAPVTFTITDTSGQFQMVPPSTSNLGANGMFTPAIRFSPIRIGFQTATLTVFADGETRTFTLRAFGAGAGAEFMVNNTILGPSVGLFTNVYGCAGVVANTQAITIRSLGSEPFVINGIDFLKIDTSYGQGVPRYPLVRDRFGNPVAMGDYIIGTTPGAAGGIMLPDTIPAGQTRTYYITYIGSEPGKRFARAFIRTNGENILGTSTTGQLVEGLLNFELFGRAIGAELSDNRTTRSLKTMTFSETRVGDSIDMTYQMFNSGDCDLRISLERLMIATGDLADFRLLSAFGRTIVEGVPMTGDAIIAPDASASITVRFKPQRNGSRRATIWIQTNDSSHFDGVSERGAYYLDLYGYGKAFLDYSDLKLKATVIGGAPSIGTARVVNSSTTTVGIQSIEIIGGDAAQFTQHDAAGVWPLTPFNLAPGAEMPLGVQFLPTGTPGARATTIRITTTTGEVINVAVTAEAGSQALTVSPGRLFVGTAIVPGEISRATVMISNTGTLPIRLNTPTITGPGASEYSLGALARLVVEPGATEYLEVTFAPTISGSAVATLTIGSDAGTQTVSLEGVATRTRPIDPTSPATTGGVNIDQPIITLNPNSNSTSAVRDAAAIAGVSFEAVRPNPARERAELVFTLAKSSDIRLELYDGTGRLLRTMVSGPRAAGEHRVTVDVSDLGAGVYHCRLATDGVQISRNVVVVR